MSTEDLERIYKLSNLSQLTPEARAKTAALLLAFFEDQGLHIGDGIENCSGYDDAEMQAAAEKLADMIAMGPYRSSFVEEAAR